MKNFTLLVLLLFSATLLKAQNVITVTDEDLNGTTTWTNDNEYILDGFVFLEEGTLTIQPGTVIRGREVPSTGDNASALIITTGAKINAVGTADNPIIFTAEDDDLSDPADLDVKLDRGLWGGLLLLGKGVLGFNDTEAQVEGIESTEVRARYGGTDDTHNSGVLKYVSIRHGGAELSEDNEINGLTMGGVGSQTVIEHVEVIANDDDGFEWFGGTVNCKWLISAFNKDDAFDYDFGWRGKGQFWFVVQADDLADNAGEHDGAKDDDKTPYSNPVIYNVTYIGSGMDASAADLKNSTALHFRDNAAGTYANSIFTDFKNYAIEVEDLASGVDSRQNMEAGELALKNNIWYGFGSGSELNAGENGIIRATEGAEDPTAQFLVDHLTNNNNSQDDPMLRGISRETDNGLDPRPSSASPAWTMARAELPGEWFSQADYIGAFGLENWVTSWTALDEYGYIGDLSVGIYDISEAKGFNLGQNYPNPFNGSTTIEYSVDSKTFVNLSVFDIAGKVVKTLVNETKTKGSYKVQISNLERGIYLYQLVAGNNKAVKKMIVK